MNKKLLFSVSLIGLFFSNNCFATSATTTTDCVGTTYSSITTCNSSCDGACTQCSGGSLYYCVLSIATDFDSTDITDGSIDTGTSIYTGEIDGGSTVVCPSNCNACDSTGACTTCASGYYVVSGACSACPTISNGTCTTCTSATVCSGATCNTDYVFESGKCVFNGSCSTNCNACTSASNCTLCKDGYFLESGACTSCATKFTYTYGTCTACTSSGCTSIECKSGYKLNSDGTNCISGVKKCATSDDYTDSCIELDTTKNKCIIKNDSTCKSRFGL